MVDFSSVQFPKPKNWQDLETRCVVLFQAHLKNPAVTGNGRGGQAQAGVDVYGSYAAGYMGVQCKCKQDGEEVTNTELETEVKKALTFFPKLTDFVLVTTAPNDAKIQKKAREITERLKTTDHPLKVEVWGWEQVSTVVSQYPEAIRAFHPDATPFSNEILANQKQALQLLESQREALNENNANVGNQLNEIMRLLSAANAKPVGQLSYQDMSATEAKIDEHLHQEINNYRDMIKKGRAKTAYELLESLKNRIWSTASSRVKFRVTTNMGAAKQTLREHLSAASLFKEAFQYDPSDKIAVNNEILAHLLLNEDDKAAELAIAAVQKDKSNCTAAAYLIRARLEDASVSLPSDIQGLPDECWEDREVIVATIYFLRKRQNPDWQGQVAKARQKWPDDTEIARLFAETIIEDAANNTDFAIGGKTPRGTTKPQVEDARKILAAAWDAIKDTEERTTEPELMYNLAFVSRLCGDDTAAYDLSKRAFEAFPDRDFIRHQYCLLANLLEGKDVREILKAGNSQECTTLLAHILCDEDSKSGRAFIEGLDLSNWTSDRQILLRSLVVETFVAEKDFSGAKSELERLIQKFPDEIAPVIQMVRVYRAEGPDVDALEKLLETAKGKLKVNTRIIERFSLAHILFGLQRYDDAVDVLNGYVDIQRDSECMRLLLAAYINSDRRVGLGELLNSIPSDVRQLEFYSLIDAKYALRIGDHKGALKKLSELVVAHPQNLEAQILRLQLYQATSREGDIKKVLALPLEDYKGDVEQKMLLAYLLIAYGFSERGLALAYSTLLRNYSDSRAHLRYTGLLLLQDDPTLIDLSIKTVSENVSFSIVSDSGERKTYVIESNSELHQFRQDSVSPSDELAKNFMGRSINDEVSVGRAKWKIIEVKHKYLDALHRCMDGFEIRFPNVGGLEKYTVNEHDQDSLQEVLQRVKDRHDNIVSAVDEYKQSPFAFNIFARRLGSTVFDAYLGVTADAKYFRSCLGTREERDEALAAVKRKQGNGCLVDALTLYMARRYHLEPTLKQLFGDIYVTQATVDAFRAYLDDLKSYRGKEYMTLFWKGGQYLRQEVKPDELERWITTRTEDLEWIEKNCKIALATGKEELPDTLRLLSLKMGRHFLDDILAAQGNNLIFLCEDFGYRIIARVMGKVSTTWIQPMLMIAKDKGFCSLSEYSTAVAKLAASGHNFTSVDKDVLLFHSTLEGEPYFNEVLGTLLGPSAEPTSHLNVIYSFLKELWANSVSLETLRFTNKMLVKLLGYAQGEWRDMLLEVISFIPRFRRPKFYENLLVFLKGHFIIHWEENDLLNVLVQKSSQESSKKKKRKRS